MIQTKTNWDKQLEYFRKLSYADKLNFWIENKFYKVHYCKFNSIDAIAIWPQRKDQLDGKLGEFSIHPEGHDETLLFIQFIIDHLMVLTNTDNLGLKDKISNFESRMTMADNPGLLIKSELEYVDLMVESLMRSFEGMSFDDGYLDSATGLLLDNFNKNSTPTINIRYFTGAIISKYEKYLKERLSSSTNSSQQQKQSPALDLTTIGVLIKIMQDCNLFPISEPKKIDEFVGQLISQSPQSIGQGRETATKIFLKDLTPHQKSQHVPRVKKLSSILVALGDTNMLKRYNELLEQLTTKK